MSLGRTVSINVNDVKFDPEDELGTSFKQQTCVFYVYLNNILKGTTKYSDAQSSVSITLPPNVLADQTNVIRIIARDHGITLPNGDFAQVGTISLNIDYVKNVQEQNFGNTFTQWITLFDDPEDDEYDGDLGEDDEELPMIKTNMVIGNATAPASSKQASR